MPLEMEQREIEGLVILVLHGDLILGSESVGLQDRVAELIEQQKIKVILDLEEVPYIDSTGLGILISAHMSFEKAGGALKLLHLSKRNLELLVLTRLSFVFQTFDDEQTAINSFFPDREVKRFDILEFVRSQENTESESDSESGEPGANNADNSEVAAGEVSPAEPRGRE